MTQARDPSLDPLIEAPDSADRAWYLYGIVRAPQPSGEGADGSPLDSLRVGGMSLEVLAVGDLCAVVKPVPRSDFTDEALQRRLRDATSLEEMVRGHNQVIAAIHDEQAILPAKFGAVYASLSDLHDALEDDASTLRAQLGRVEGCDEWAVHTYAEREAIERDVASTNPSIRRLREDLAGASPGRAYFLQRKLADDLATVTEQALMELAESAYQHMRRMAVDGHVSSSDRSTSGQGGAIEVLRAAFLVRRADAEAFISAVDSFAADRAGVRCEYSGPWPTYSFAAEG